MAINLIPVAKIVFVLQTTKGKSIYSILFAILYTTYSIIERNLYRESRFYITILPQFNIN